MPLVRAKIISSTFQKISLSFKETAIGSFAGGKKFFINFHTSKILSMPIKRDQKKIQKEYNLQSPLVNKFI